MFQCTIMMIDVPQKDRIGVRELECDSDVHIDGALKYTIRTLNALHSERRVRRRELLKL